MIVRMCQNHGSFVLKCRMFVHFHGSFRLKKTRNMIKLNVFSWKSLQTWELLTWSMKNVNFWWFCQKHRVLRWNVIFAYFRGALYLKFIFPWALALFCTKVWELRTWKKRPCQNHGASVLTRLASSLNTQIPLYLGTSCAKVWELRV